MTFATYAANGSTVSLRGKWQLQATGHQPKLSERCVHKTKPVLFTRFPLEDDNWIIVGDFNGHSLSWGYHELDRWGDNIEAWRDENSLLLINKVEDPNTCTFYTIWHTTPPDLGLATEDLHSWVLSPIYAPYTNINKIKNI